MKNKQSLLSLLPRVFLIFFALLCVLMLAFPTTYNYDYRGDVWGEFRTVQANGFSHLFFKKDFFRELYQRRALTSTLTLVFGTLSAVQLAFGFVSVCFSIRTLTTPFNEKIYKKIFIGGLISLFLYAIAGFLLTWYYNDQHSRYEHSYYGSWLTTTSYIPLIIGIVLIIGFFISKKLFAKNQPGTPPTPTSTVSTSPSVEKNDEFVANEETILALLESYKKLLDSGVITEKEFEAKKKQLLNR